jgi:hypothetical protein
MFVLYTVIAVIITTLIETARIFFAYGQVENINKIVTYTIGATLFGINLACIYANSYYNTPGVFEILVLGVFYAAVRGVLYDPILNVARGKNINYTSITTNSVVDFIERVGLKWGFWTERLVYLLIAVLTGLMYTALQISINI